MGIENSDKNHRSKDQGEKVSAIHSKRMRRQLSKVGENMLLNFLLFDKATFLFLDCYKKLAAVLDHISVIRINGNWLIYRSSFVLFPGTPR